MKRTAIREQTFRLLYSLEIQKTDNIEEQILITTSCKAAVKANTYLNSFQMQEIIKNWRTCEKPFTCPHGRPISHIVEHKDIAKFFQRTK